MYRERLTITLDKDLLAAVDATVDHSQIRNRSHAIEHAIREGLALHELTHAMITVSPDGAERLPELTALLERLPIKHYLVISAPGNLAAAQDVTRSLIALTHREAEVIPGDFGTGAAILLSRAKLATPFLYVRLSHAAHLPENLTPAYMFHRRGSPLVTHLVRSDGGGTFAETGVSILNPEIADQIPAGLASLEEAIFPALLKAGKVGAYVI